MLSRLLVVYLVLLAVTSAKEVEMSKEHKEELMKIDNMLKVKKEKTPDYYGHMKPLGASLKKPLKVKEIKYFPNPIDFFDDYVKPSLPVVFRGAANIFPHLDKFRDDKWMNETFGNWEVDIETSKKENILKQSNSLTFANFTRIYKEFDVYMLSDINQPSKLADMTYLPKSLLCADFLRGINSVYMQLSSGKTNSYLRRDEYEHLVCQYDGTTTYTLGNRRHRHFVKLTEEEHVDVDVDKVDMKKYPELSRMPWYQTKIGPGDCLYIPYRWFVQARASKGRNQHVGTYFCPLIEMFSRKGCIKKMKKVPSKAPWGKIKMADEEVSNKKRLVALFADTPQPFNNQQFYEVLLSEMPIGTQLKQSVVNKIFKQIDTNGDGVIKYIDMYKANNQVLGALYYIFHGTVSETVEYATGIEEYSRELINQMETIKKKAEAHEAEQRAERLNCKQEQQPPVPGTCNKPKQEL